MEKRASLMLVYYPSKFDFYWFMARLVNLLKRRNDDLIDPLPEIKQRMEALMKGTSTQHILKEAKKSEEKGIYWVQFLGNYADKNRNEDAIFSTALALNALFDTWTTKQGDKVCYDEDTPEEVKAAISSGIEYLMNNLK